MRSQGPDPSLYVVSTEGASRRYGDADAIVLSPPQLVRFDGDKAYLRSRLDDDETLHPNPVLAPHLTVDPAGRVWVADPAGRIVDLEGRPHPTQPPVPLYGVKTDGDNVSLLQGFDESGQMCVAKRCAPDQCWPPIESVHVSGARVWGRAAWRLGRRRTCHGPKGWTDENIRPRPPSRGAGSQASHVLGPRNGWIVWRTQWGSMPRYFGEGGASSGRVGSEDPTESGPEDGVLPHGWPVALSPDGQTTLVCREPDSEYPWPHPSRCGVMPTAALDVEGSTPAVGGPTTRSSASRSGGRAAAAFVPVLGLENAGALIDAAVLP